MSDCNCGAATEGKWADKHSRGCPALDNGPMARARRIVTEYTDAYGRISHPQKLIDAIAIMLGFTQLAATPHTRDIAAGPTDAECAVVCMLVSNPQNVLRKNGWQKRVNDTIRALRDERNELRAALASTERGSQQERG